MQAMHKYMIISNIMLYDVYCILYSVFILYNVYECYSGLYSRILEKNTKAVE